MKHWFWKDKNVFGVFNSNWYVIIEIWATNVPAYDI